MGITASILDDILRDTAPGDDILEAVRERRDKVRRIARRYPGAHRTYMSGSVAHNTANDDTDGDCGVVLDRRSYPRPWQGEPPSPWSGVDLQALQSSAWCGTPGRKHPTGVDEDLESIVPRLSESERR